MTEGRREGRFEVAKQFLWLCQKIFGTYALSETVWWNLSIHVGRQLKNEFSGGALTCFLHSCKVVKTRSYFWPDSTGPSLVPVMTAKEVRTHTFSRMKFMNATFVFSPAFFELVVQIIQLRRAHNDGPFTAFRCPLIGDSLSLDVLIPVVDISVKDCVASPFDP